MPGVGPRRQPFQIGDSWLRYVSPNRSVRLTCRRSVLSQRHGRYTEKGGVFGELNIKAWIACTQECLCLHFAERHVPSGNVHSPDTRGVRIEQACCRVRHGYGHWTNRAMVARQSIAFDGILCHVAQQKRVPGTVVRTRCTLLGAVFLNVSQPSRLEKTLQCTEKFFLDGT